MSYMPNGGKISTVNSTSTPLGISGVFTGTAEEVTNFGVIVVTTYSDKASATDGLSVQFSSDGTNWDSNDVYTISALSGKTFSFQCPAKYFRVVYTNGVIAQTTFRLQTSLKQIYTKPSSHRIKDSIVGDDDAEIIKAALTGENGDGSWHNVKTTHDGYLAISDNSSGLSIAQGDVTGASFIHKFGEAPDFDSTDGIVSMYDGADDAHINQMQYVYSTSADIDSISSDETGDTQTIEIQGLDSNHDIVIQTKALSGRTRVALDTALIRVFRLKNIGTVDNAGHVFCYVNTGLTLGKPTDTTKIRAAMQPGHNQTLMAIFTIPDGKTGYLQRTFASTSKANKDTQYIVDTYARPFGQVFQLKNRFALSDKATSIHTFDYKVPEKFSAKTDIELRVAIADGAKTDAGVAGGFDIVLIDD